MNIPTIVLLRIFFHAVTMIIIIMNLDIYESVLCHSLKRRLFYSFNKLLLNTAIRTHIHSHIYIYIIIYTLEPLIQNPKGSREKYEKEIRHTSFIRH